MATAADTDVLDLLDHVWGAVSALAGSYHRLRSALDDAPVDLDAELGSAAGPFEHSTRRSFVLHLVDELVHHGAEAALLRDLYTSSTR